MKKFLCLLMAIATVGCFAACSSDLDKKCDECGADGNITITSADLADPTFMASKYMNLVVEWDDGEELCMQCGMKKYMDNEELDEAELEKILAHAEESLKENYPELEALGE